MRNRILPTPSQQKRIKNAIIEHKALKEMDKVLNDYNGKSFKILKIRQIVKNKLKQK